MNWNGFLSILNFIFMSFGSLFAPTHTMEPISIINHIGESPAVPSLNKLIWTSSHCQDFLVGDMISFNEPTIPSAVNTATMNDQRIHNHNRKQQNLDNLNKNQLKKHRIKNISSKNNIAPDILPIDEKFNSVNKNNNENYESSDQKRSKKRIISNTPESSQTIESLDDVGNIGSVFEDTDSPHGLISEYASNLSKLRERFNYASIDCGANVLKANKEAKGSSAILSESKDYYLLNKCSAEKYIIVELCYPILVDTIVLANFEFFSSTFKNIRISISKWYPPKEDWKVMGEYRAKNSRELQIFTKAPIMFAKYLRIEFQSHYGHFYYCPISLLRVHGYSETDMWNKEQEQDVISSSASQEESQLNDESNGDTLQNVLPSTELTEKDLNKLSNDIQTNSEYFGNLKVEDNNKLQPEQDTRINNQDAKIKKYIAKIKNIFEYGVCPRNDPLNVRIFQDSSLIISPGICHIDLCPTIVTESDLLSDNYSEIISSNNRLLKKDNAIKKTPLPVQSKQNKTEYNGKINLSIGGSNQSTYMFLFKRILMLELNATVTKRYIEGQSKILKEVYGEVDSHSKKIDSIMNNFTDTVENLRKQYEQLLQATFSEFHANQSKLEEGLKDLTSNVHLLAAKIVFLKRLLLFAFLSFLIYIGITHDWVNVRRSLQDLHATMNARAFTLKLKTKSVNMQRKNTDDFYDDNINDIYSE